MGRSPTPSLLCGRVQAQTEILRAPKTIVTNATKESNAVARRAGIVGLGTLASRILGAARESVTAAFFPLAATDAFFVAFTIPNALRSILGEGAVASAFVPVFTEAREKEGLERAKAFHRNLSGVFVAVLALVTVAGVTLAPWAVTLYAAGYRSDPERFGLATSLTRVVFPYIFFMGVAALGMGVLNAQKKFAVPAFAPALLNVAMIAAPFLLVPICIGRGADPVMSLAWGALAGGLLQVLAQRPALAREGFGGWPRFDLRDPYVRKTLKLLGPLVLGLGVYQINLILSRQIASFLPEGAQSFVYYASRVVDLPLGVFSLAIGTAALPSLAEAKQRGSADDVRAIAENAHGLSLFVAMPASFVLFALAEPSIVVLFERGAFTHAVALEAASALGLQALGIVAISSIRVIVPVYYAHNDTRMPVIASTANLVVFGVTALALLSTLGHLAISLALSVASFAQLIVLYVAIRRRVGDVLRIGVVVKQALVTGVSAALAGAAAYLVARSLGTWSLGGNSLTNILAFVTALTTAVVVYLGVAFLLKAPMLDPFVRAIKRRF